MISFDNTAQAFAYKTTPELKKARFLFNAMGNSFLLHTGLRLIPAMIKYRIPFSTSLVRNTIFDQFVGGETLEQTAAVAAKLARYHVQIILDYGVEGGDDSEAGFDQSTDVFIRVINYAATQPNIPYMSVKVTGISRTALLEKIDSFMHSGEGTLMKRYTRALEQLSESEQQEWSRVVNRLQRICTTAASKNIGVQIDAEETWIQDPVDAISMLMMDTHNRQQAVVFNTLQHYRHDRLAFLRDSITAADERNFILGLKLVRGAYMDKERQRAAEKGYPSPIQPDKASTDRDYNAATRLCIEHINRVSFVVASHNEESNALVTRWMDENQLPHDHPHVHFSQLYGMSDNITFNLARAGFNVSKYLPFGPIKDVIHYLMRRAIENSSVAGQTGRELGLIHKELKRRSEH